MAKPLKILFLDKDHRIKIEKSIHGVFKVTKYKVGFWAFLFSTEYFKEAFSEEDALETAAQMRKEHLDEQYQDFLTQLGENDCKVK